MNRPETIAAGAGLSVIIDGRAVSIDLPPVARLTEALREGAGVKGVKVGCDAGDCGACTVLLDGEPVCACMTALGQAEGRRVDTVEGLAKDGQLAKIQQAFLDHGAAQCGICTPGMLVSAAALLERNPSPSEAEALDALGGVLCRCTGYRKIVQAVLSLAPDQPDLGRGGSVGAPVPRIDGRPKVTGDERFGDDVAPAGALVMRVIRSPHHAARFAFGDLDGFVTTHPGIEAVFTAADIPGENRFGVIPPFAEQPALAQGHARFRGEAVALVVGERTAMAALDLTEFPVSWTTTDAAMTPETARAAPDIHADRKGNILVSGYVERGDVSALGNAAHRVSDSFRTSFTGRLRAIAASHDLLVSTRQDSADLSRLVADQLKGYAPAEPDRLTIAGPSTTLGPQGAHAFGLILHELATNASKYGAFSNASGRVRVSWVIAGEAAEPDIVIEWEETDGPPVASPSRKGFGSLLIEQSLAHSLGGESRLEFNAEGLKARFRFPVKR